MVKRKIAISGKAGSGKNTVAELLGLELASKNAELRSCYKIFAFADPMKEMILKMYPQTNPDVLWGPSHLRATLLPNSDLTYRQLLLDLGKLGRGYDKNIWINAILHFVDQYVQQNQSNIAFIADVRFKNELNSITQQDFFKIRVVRPNHQTGFSSTDISEIDLDDVSADAFDLVLTNDGTMDQLRSQISIIAKTYF